MLPLLLQWGRQARWGWVLPVGPRRAGPVERKPVRGMGRRSVSLELGSGWGAYPWLGVRLGLGLGLAWVS